MNTRRQPRLPAGSGGGGQWTEFRGDPPSRVVAALATPEVPWRGVYRPDGAAQIAEPPVPVIRDGFDIARGGARCQAQREETLAGHGWIDEIELVGREWRRHLRGQDEPGTRVRSARRLRRGEKVSVGHDPLMDDGTSLQRIYSVAEARRGRMDGHRVVELVLVGASGVEEFAVPHNWPIRRVAKASG
mgnify:CR=1 FL=1